MQLFLLVTLVWCCKPRSPRRLSIFQSCEWKFLSVELSAFFNFSYRLSIWLTFELFIQTWLINNYLFKTSVTESHQNFYLFLIDYRNLKILRVKFMLILWCVKRVLIGRPSGLQENSYPMYPFFFKRERKSEKQVFF